MGEKLVATARKTPTGDEPPRGTYREISCADSSFERRRFTTAAEAEGEGEMMMMTLFILAEFCFSTNASRRMCRRRSATSRSLR
jgi:hypothetical protein